MAKKPTYEELEKRIKELETEALESKRANEVLRASALSWNTTFDAITDSVCLIDVEGKILQCNKATANFLGKPINEIVGNTCWELVHGTSEPIKGCPIVRMRETRRPESLELPVGDRVLYVYTEPILDQDGNVAMAVHTITDITDIKQAEEAIRESELKYRGLFDNSTDFIYTMDLKGNFTDVNKAAEHLTGYTKNELIGMNFRSFSQKDTHEEIFQAFNSVIKEGKPLQDFPLEVIIKDGTKRYFETSVGPLKKDNDIIGFQGSSRDITERKQADDKINHLNLVLRSIRKANQIITKEKDQDRLLQSACDNLIENRGYYNAWIVLLDEAGKFVTATESGLGKNFLPMADRLKGGKLTDCGQRALRQSEVVVTKDPLSSCTDCPLSDQYSGRGAMTIHLEHEGKIYGLLSVSIPIYSLSDKEEQSLFQEISADIAFALNRIELEKERKQLEAELLVKNEVFEASITANSTSDNEGILTYVNNAFIKIFGYENKEEAVGKPISDFLKFEDEAMNIITALNETGVWEGEYTGLRKDGTTFAAYGLATIIKDRSGDSIGYQSAVLDISDRKRMEEILRESEEKYSSVVENSIDGIIVLQKGIIKFLNQAILGLTGYNLEELIDKEFETLLSPEYRKLVMDRYQARLAGKDVPSMYEMEIIRKDGISVPIEVSNTTITYGGEKSTLSFLRNITERKLAEEKEKEHHKNIQLLSNAAMKFVEFPADKNIYNFIGEQIREFIGKDSYIVINTVDEESILTTRAVLGIGKFTDKMAKLMGRHPVGMTFNAKDEELLDLSDGKFHLYEKGLYGIIQKTVPKAVCNSIEKLLNIKEIYGIGFTKEKKLFGNATIFLKEDAEELKNKQITEAFIKQASIAVQKRQTEEALQESEEKHRLLAENTVDCIWQMNLDMEFTYINQAILPFLGYTPKEWIGSKLPEHCSSEELEKMQAIIADVLANLPDKTTEVFETSLYHKNGEEIPCEISGKIVLDDAGNHIYFQGTTRDITERKQAEEELRDSEGRLKTILDSIQGGIVIINAETHTIVDLNPAAIKMIGAPEEEIVGHVCHKYICPAEKGKCPITDLGQKVDNSERILLTANGEEVPILKTVTQITLGGKECLLDSFIDITEKKKLESQLQQAQKMEAIGTLAGGIAHDFNNILGAIIGYTEIASLQVAEDDKAKESMKEVLKAGLRAKNLVKQILAFSRKGEQERIPVQISLIVKEALKLLRSSLPTTIEIRQNIESDTGIVEADPTQIHQIMMNLCTNAGHAMREEGGVLEVGIRDVEVGSWDSELGYLDMTPGSYLLLTVSDTGEGMTPEILGRIFDPYFTTKEKGVGTGLGLAVVHGIVKIYGGTIRAYSEPGKGTTFHVYLPRIEEAKEMAEEESRPGVIPTGQERILFIDDEPVLVEIGKQMLERLGYEVTTRTSSIEALELFKAKPDRFDLVITDMTMPNMTGDKLSRELMQIRHDIPIIICTGYSERITEDKAKGMGIKAFVMKPIVIRDLANSVREVLEGGKEKPAEGLILVIDDDDQFRGMLREMLGRAGYEVADAPNGKEGIRLYRENPADLVITDIIMPEKEGIETIMDLRREFPEVKIIAMSGGGRIDPEEYLHMAKRLGADRTFAKPVERDELLKAVREVLGDPALSKRKG